LISFVLELVTHAVLLISLHFSHLHTFFLIFFLQSLPGIKRREKLAELYKKAKCVRGYKQSKLDATGASKQPS
jgi:hypothetical protein